MKYALSVSTYLFFSKASIDLLAYITPECAPSFFPLPNNLINRILNQLYLILYFSPYKQSTVIVFIFIKYMKSVSF